jgi:hypothetical protein
MSRYHRTIRGKGKKTRRSVHFARGVNFEAEGTNLRFGALVIMRAFLPDVVRVTVRREPSGVFVALSPDLPGPLAVELVARRLSVAVPERIQAWFAAEGCPVRVIKSEGRAAALSSWNVMPEAGCAEQEQGCGL